MHRQAYILCKFVTSGHKISIFNDLFSKAISIIVEILTFFGSIRQEKIICLPIV